MHFLLLLSLAFGGVAKDLHKGLHAAEEDPTVPPPPFLFDEQDQARLDAGETVFHYEHIKGHDLAVAAVTTWVDRWEVWSQIRKIEAYPESLTGVAWAKTLEATKKSDHEHLMVEMEIEVPVPLVSGKTKLEAHHYRDVGYLVFQQVDEKGSRRALKHAIGYWSVTPMGGGKSLVMMFLDVRPDFPIPVPMREDIARTAMPLLVWNVARTAEESMNERTKFMNEQY